MDEYDLIVIGSGFGGTMAAAPAVLAGKRVLLLESGGWIARGPENWGPTGLAERTPYYSRANAFDVLAGGYGQTLGTYACVGGASNFYGGVALRMREADFLPDPLIDHGTGAAWPYRYADLEPFYTQAEQLLQVAGSTGADPTEPPRSADYPRAPGPLAPISQRLADAATSLGLHPFRLPLAINYLPDDGRTPCPACGTCDGFACAVQAKNDLSTVLIPKLQQRGLELVINTAAVRLDHDNGRVTDVVCLRRDTAEPIKYRGRAVAVACGALATPRLLLASGLDRINPSGDLVGRYLMRHCNAVVMGLFRSRPAPHGEFHKQIGIHDYYFGHPSVDRPRGRLGCLQQFATPEPALVRYNLPLGFGHVVAPVVSHTTGFIVMAEDRPRAINRVALAGPATTSHALPRATVTHEYDPRDVAARDALVGAARKILRRAGALVTYSHPIKTFSHALGTVRLGVDAKTSPLDASGLFRGTTNLFVTDASALPRSAGVNPSLTIAANALRTGTQLLDAL
ncbi:MAG TPA: GMC family oxidoreductase [Vicinamibacterales bacterium]|nr:GMC family oxidoreductase [Vicinamibacterales bacterium]